MSSSRSISNVPVELRQYLRKLDSNRRCEPARKVPVVTDESQVGDEVVTMLHLVGLTLTLVSFPAVQTGKLGGISTDDQIYLILPLFIPADTS